MFGTWVCLIPSTYSPVIYLRAWGENCQKSKKRVPTFWQLLALFVLTPKKRDFFFPSWNKISSNKASFFKLQEKPFLEKRPKICKKATQKRRSGTNLRVVMDWTQTPKCGFGLGFRSIRQKMFLPHSGSELTTTYTIHIWGINLEIQSLGICVRPNTMHNTGINCWKKIFSKALSK